MSYSYFDECISFLLAERSFEIETFAVCNTYRVRLFPQIWNR